LAEDIIGQITRAGVATPIAKNITFEMTRMNAQEASFYQGADPHFTYTCHTTLLPAGNPQLVQFRDHVVDQIVVDTVTNQLRKWLIISDPNLDIITGDWKFICVRMVGK
jgi:hypothetical protein